MSAAFSPRRNTTVAIIGADNYARSGISSLIQDICPDIHIRASVREPKVLDLFLAQTPVDILFLSEYKAGTHGYDCISYIQNLKHEYPEMNICIYSDCNNLYVWAGGAADEYLSTNDPVYSLTYQLKRILTFRRGTLNRLPVRPLPLSHTEWSILKGLKDGLSMHHIAANEEITYRRVSALKTSAIRKLGLRNKTDLLVFLTS
ncbi:LuxR C-terminal-related transcriptional regulator [Enterobacteriaceae bacterium C23F]